MRPLITYGFLTEVLKLAVFFKNSAKDQRGRGQFDLKCNQNDHYYFFGKTGKNEGNLMTISS